MNCGKQLTSSTKEKQSAKFPNSNIVNFLFICVLTMSTNITKNSSKLFTQKSFSVFGILSIEKNCQMMGHLFCMRNWSICQKSFCPKPFCASCQKCVLDAPYLSSCQSCPLTCIDPKSKPVWQRTQRHWLLVPHQDWWSFSVCLQVWSVQVGVLTTRNYK